MVGFIRMDLGAVTTGGGGGGGGAFGSSSRMDLGLSFGGADTAEGGGRLIALLGSLPDTVTVVTGMEGGCGLGKTGSGYVGEGIGTGIFSGAVSGTVSLSSEVSIGVSGSSSGGGGGSSTISGSGFISAFFTTVDEVFFGRLFGGSSSADI